jgi:hypothetical protein
MYIVYSNGKYAKVTNKWTTKDIVSWVDDINESTVMIFSKAKIISSICKNDSVEIIKVTREVIIKPVSKAYYN